MITAQVTRASKERRANGFDGDARDEDEAHQHFSSLTIDYANKLQTALTQVSHCTQYPEADVASPLGRDCRSPRILPSNPPS